MLKMLNEVERGGGRGEAAAQIVTTRALLKFGMCAGAACPLTGGARLRTRLRARMFPQLAARASAAYANPNLRYLPPEQKFQGSWDISLLLAWSPSQAAVSKHAADALPVADLAASFEQVVADVLVERTTRCARDQGLNTLVMVGGVAANRRLRARLEQRCAELGLAWRVAPLTYCTDNAAMIGVAAEQRFLAGCRSPIDLAVAPRLALADAPVLYEPQPAF